MSTWQSHSQVGQSLSVLVHGKEQLTVAIFADRDRLRPGERYSNTPVRLMDDGETYVVKMHTDQGDVVKFFTHDPMQLAETLHSLADAVTDAYWHEESVFGDCDCPDHEHRAHDCPAQEVKA